MNKLARYKQTATGRKGNNASRDFHRFVHRAQKAYPVTITNIRLPIRKKVKVTAGRRRARLCLVDYPVIHLSSWMRIILEKHPRFLLGGHCPLEDGGQAYMNMFEQFWSRFESVQPDHPIHQRSTDQKRRTIPFALHGDEGRGLAKVPLLVISFQALIPFSGPNELNCSKFLGSACSD